jgi:hypothetical protein
LPLLVTWFFVALALPLLVFLLDARLGSPLLEGLHRLDVRPGTSS